MCIGVRVCVWGVRWGGGWGGGGDIFREINGVLH